MSSPFYFGVVENILDPLMCGRAQVRIFGLHTDDKNLLPTEKLPWALPILPLTSASISGIGQSPLGIVCGSHVCIEFMDKYKQQPVMIGTLPGVPLLNTSTDMSYSEESQSLVGINSYEKNANLTTTPPDNLNTDIYNKIFPKVIENCAKWGITAEEKVKYVTAAIMAIAGGECGFQSKGLEEGCFYRSPTKLAQVFRVFKTPADAMPYINMKDKATFFEKVYGVDSGKGKELGNTKTGDGGKYYGRGLIQITGKGMYQSISDILNKRGFNVDFVKEPDSIISDENIVPATFAFFEKKGLFKNIDNIGYGWFEVAMAATGKDASGGYAKKRNYYKQILQVSNIQSNPTNLKVGDEGPITKENVQEIQNQQTKQAQNLVASELKDFKNDFTNDNSITKNLFDLQNNVENKLKEQKNLVQDKVKESFLTKDSLNIWDGMPNIFNTLSAAANDLSFVSDHVDKQTNQIITSINDTITETQDEIVDYANGIIEKAQNAINDLLNVNKLLDDYVFNRIDAIIEKAYTEIQNKAISYAQHLIRKLNNPIDRINSALSNNGINLPPRVQQMLNRIRIPNAQQIIAMQGINIETGLDALFKNIANNIGYTKEQLSEMMNDRKYFATKGFLDPNGKYPLRSNIGEPATNKLARGCFDGTIVEWKANNNLKNIPIGGVNNDEFLNETNNETTWSVPAPSLGGQYPYTKVNQSESGHTFIVDDTPGKETISNNHRSGTYDDVYANGVKVQRIVGDGYEIIDRNGYVYIAGRLIMNIMDGSNVHINGNCYTDVQGSYNVRATGGINFDTESDINFKAKGNINLQSLNLSAKTSESIRFKSEQSLLMEATQFLSLKSIDLLSIQSQSTIAVRSVDDIVLNSLSAIDINSTKDLLMSSKEQIAIQSENSTSINSNNTINIHAKSNLNLQTESRFNVKSNNTIIESDGDVNVKSGSNFNIFGSNSVSVKSSGWVSIDGSMTWLQSGKSNKALSATKINIEKYKATEIDSIQPLNIPDIKMSIFFTPPAMSLPQLNTPALSANKVNAKFEKITDEDKSE